MTSIVTKKETVTVKRYSKTVPGAPLGNKIMIRKSIRKKVVKRWYSKNNITNADLIAMAEHHDYCINEDDGEINWNKLSEVNAE